MILLIQLIILGILFILSGFFSSAETAFTSLSSIQVRTIADRKGVKGKRVEKLAQSPDILLTTLLIGNNLVNIAASALATTITIENFGSSFLGLSTGILTLFILVFGEVTPKQLALANNESISLFSSGVIYVLSYVFRPFIWFISAISNFITTLFTHEEKHHFSIENVLHMVHIAADMGIVGSHEQDLVKKIFRVKSLTAQSLMTHRKDVFFLDKEQTIEEVYQSIIDQGYSRLPVYQDNPENIVGIVLLKDLIRHMAERGSSIKLKELMVEPLYVPEMKKANDLFFLFKKEKLNMAIVLDEYGGLAGVVSREDVVEAILGELYDENEQRESAPIKTSEKGVWLLKGDADFYEIQDATGVTLRHDNTVFTISGYLSQNTQSIPEEGDTIVLPEGKYTILKRNKNKIETIQFIPSIINKTN